MVWDACFFNLPFIGKFEMINPKWVVLLPDFIHGIPPNISWKFPETIHLAL